MKVLQVKKYNAIQKIKYSKSCEKWKPLDGGFPQAAFYFFSTTYGTYRKTGYVAFEKNKAIWRPTKKEAMEEFIK
jgi:hypothetical protein